MKVNEAKVILKSIMEVENPPAVMLWGAPGVGKSAIVAQIAEELEMGFIDLRLLMMNPVDLRGVPVPDKEHKKANWLTAGFLPDAERDGDRGILLLDEINAASPVMQASAYQLVHDKKCGDYKLPEGWRIVMAGNRKQDRGVTNTMPTPLANRALHFDLEATIDDWKTWAFQVGIHPHVIAFLSYRSELLHKMPENKPEITAFPTPRSWNYVSNLYDRVPKLQLPIIIEAAIGPGPAAEFMAYVSMADRLPSIDDILNGKKIKFTEKGSDVMYAVASGIVYGLLKDHASSRIDNMLAFIDEHVPTEYQVKIMNDIQDANLSVMTKIAIRPDYRAWSSKNSDFVYKVG